LNENSALSDWNSEREQDTNIDKLSMSVTKYIQGGPKKVSHNHESSLNHIKTRH